MALPIKLRGQNVTREWLRDFLYSDEERGFTTIIELLIEHILAFGAGRSATELTIAPGNQVLEIKDALGGDFPATLRKHMYLRLSEEGGDGTNYMTGELVEWNDETSLGTVAVDDIGGGGTFTAWSVTVTGIKGPADGASAQAKFLVSALHSSLDNEEVLTDAGGLHMVEDVPGHAFRLSPKRPVVVIADPTYTVTTADRNRLLVFTNAAGVAVTLPDADATDDPAIENGFRVGFLLKGGPGEFSASGGTVAGAGTYTVPGDGNFFDLVGDAAHDWQHAGLSPGGLGSILAANATAMRAALGLGAVAVVNAITEGLLAAGAVTTAKLGDAAVTIAKVHPSLTETLLGGDLFRNGSLMVWQGQVSYTGTAIGLTADLWKCAFTNAHTVSRQAFTPGQADVPGEEFFIRRAPSASGGAGGFDVAILPGMVEALQAKSITVIFYARASAGTPTVLVVARQNFGAGGSASVDTAAQSAELTTSWQRFRFKFDLAATSGKTIGAGAYVGVVFGEVDGSSAAIDRAKLRVLRGDVPATQEPPRADRDLYLGLCRPYRQKSYNLGIVLGTATFEGARAFWANAGGTGLGSVHFHPPMAFAPSVTVYNPATGTAGQFRDSANTNIGATVSQVAEGGFTISGSATASSYNHVQFFAECQFG